MSKIIADRMMVDDDELHFRDADAQNKLKNMIVQEKGNSETAVMSQAAATEEFDKLSEDISDETKKRQNAVAQERNRAIARENEIEGLFSMPTQEAVSKWLDEHPEATTTVQDRSMTANKFTHDLEVHTIKEYVTPQMFGAVGDGVTDDTLSFQAAIDSVKIHGTLIIPLGEYLISDTLTINKPISIEGQYYGYDLTESSNGIDNSEYKKPLLKTTSEDSIHINTLGVRLENIAITTSGKGTIILIDLQDSSSKIGRNYVFKNLWLNGAGTSVTEYGIKTSRNIILSEFSHVIINTVKNGFHIGIDDYVCTCLTFNNCLVNGAGEKAFYLLGGEYSTFKDCATDYNKYGYYLEKCVGVSIIGCGTEVTDLSGAYIKDSNSVNVISLFGYDINKKASLTDGLIANIDSFVNIVGCSVKPNLYLQERLVYSTANAKTNIIGCGSFKYYNLGVGDRQNLTNAFNIFSGKYKDVKTITTGANGEANLLVDSDKYIVNSVCPVNSGNYVFKILKLTSGYWGVVATNILGEPCPNETLMVEFTYGDKGEYQSLNQT